MKWVPVLGPVLIIGLFSYAAVGVFAPDLNLWPLRWLADLELGWRGKVTLQGQVFGVFILLSLVILCLLIPVLVVQRIMKRLKPSR